MTASIKFIKKKEGHIQAHEIFCMDLDARNDFSFTVGRDETMCEITLKDLSVAKKHILVLFKDKPKGIYIRNLQQLNPVNVDGAALIQGEARIWQGSTIRLGYSMLVVEKLELLPSQATSSQSLNRDFLTTSSPARLITPSQSSSSQHTSQSTQEHGLQCPKCQTIHSLTSQNLSCHVCGHFLADADSVLISPKS